MDIFEFELRYKAYNGLNDKFELWRDLDTIINLVKITSRGVTDKKLQEITRNYTSRNPWINTRNLHTIQKRFCRKKQR